MTTTENYRVLGCLAWLWNSSPLHVHWPAHALGRFCLPPIERAQYCLLMRGGHPVAYCSWAYFDAPAEARYLLNPSELRQADWRCGDRLWFIDWIAPFSAHDSRTLKARLADMFPDEVARAIRVKEEGGIGRVMQFRGRNLTPAQARARLDASYRDFALHLATHANPTSP